MSKEIERPDMDNCSLKEWEKWYWQKFNDFCLKCKKTCKQSWIVKVSCSQFEGENSGTVVSKEGASSKEV